MELFILLIILYFAFKPRKKSTLEQRKELELYKHQLKLEQKREEAHIKKQMLVFKNNISKSQPKEESDLMDFKFKKQLFKEMIKMDLKEMNEEQKRDYITALINETDFNIK